ncbi:hypothetical protein CDD80_2432 [Ophiocordyceps camponoti-rufipedis]|uniref:non-specific serine/threonine protein kinase n=1 Tax=Ophiocordyceps camponoti-rufipedis TaxID=2004952 RepID=A0A2C5ZLP6_9HYPO|nr:hypothetical protein CDD80_2432 [Ophiocordyceps camponoti-rufipedis]
MASHAQQQQHMAPRSAQRQPASAPQQRLPHAPSAPAGTFSPGTKIQVGSHRVVIQKYLSEGGFAIVYLVKMPQPVDGTDLAVLKRVAVPDKDSLRNMRTEVETMKRLKGHHPIVTYIDSHASEMRGGGYEVFLLMEYCNGGGLIDFMNTRLQHRLTEPEILSIFADIAEGVACMHYLKPPLLHRDIKVENVLITSRASSKRFKLCDFGSAAPPRPAPTTVVECRLMDEDVQKHTTLQYRSPEMIDVYRKQPLNEKADIWALGVLLYKLCYYTTPFEEQGQLAILNASFRYPDYPVFSDPSMLRESIEARPNIYQVLKEACSMQGRQIPIKDIYTGRPHTADRNSKIPADPKAQPKVGAVYSAPVREKKQQIPEVAPMRRGDPFTALDSKDGSRLEADELSSRFPTLDQFSLLHDKGTKFDFDSTVSPPTEAHVSVAERRAAAEASNSPRKTLAVSDRAAGSVRSRAFGKPTAEHLDLSLTRLIYDGHLRPPDRPLMKPGQLRPRRRAPKRRKGHGHKVASSIRALQRLSAKENLPKRGLVRDAHCLVDSKTQNSAASDLIDINGADSEPVEKSNASRSVNATPPSASKKKIGGKFEDTFKRFEGNSRPDSAPVRNDDDDLNDEQATPEMRREMERRQLEEEEQRVAAAQAEYKKRLAGEGNPGPRKGGVVARSAAIQNRVQSLLEEEQRPSQVQRTAEGYGKYTDAAKPTKDKALPTLPDGLKPRTNVEPSSTSASLGALATKPTGGKPAAPKKPIHLNKTRNEVRPPSPAKRSRPEVLMAVDLPGQPVLEMSAKEKEDYVEDFAKRFPSLNTVELEAMAAAQRR